MHPTGTWRAIFQTTILHVSLVFHGKENDDLLDCPSLKTSLDYCPVYNGFNFFFPPIRQVYRG